MGWGSGGRGLAALGGLVAWALVGTALASSSGVSHFTKISGGGHSPTDPRVGAIAATLPSGRVLIAGGKSAELFNPATDTFSALTGAGQSPIEPRGGAVAATLPSGEVLIAGGGYRSPQARSAELFNPATDRFSKLRGPRHSPTEKRDGAVAARLPSGQVLIAGGLVFYFNPVTRTYRDENLRSAELFNPATDTFTKLTGAGQSLTEGRDGAVAAKLPNGDVLIAGGWNGLNQEGQSTAELFDPTTDTFTKLTGPGQSLTRGREDAVAVTLPDGQVLIAGGPSFLCRSHCVRQRFFSPAELFNPTTDTFTATESRTEDRSAAVAALLPGGQVLIAGGTSSHRRDYAPSSAELFNPASDTFAELRGGG